MLKPVPMPVPTLTPTPITTNINTTNINTTTTTTNNNNPQTTSSSVFYDLSGSCGRLSLGAALLEHFAKVECLEGTADNGEEVINLQNIYKYFT